MADIREVVASSTITTQVVTTTTELACQVSDLIPMPTDTQKILIMGWVQITTGTNTTALTVRVRRGNGITGTVVGVAQAEQIFAAAGSTESRFFMAIDNVQNLDQLQYSLTIQQTAASANGTVQQACIAVFAL